MNKNTLIFYDEPTRGLHPANIQKIMNVFDNLNGMGHTIVVADNHELA